MSKNKYSSEYKTLLDNPETLNNNKNNNNINNARRTKEFIHHRSVLFGIFIGIAFAISIFTLLPSLSMSYYQQQEIYNRDNDDTLTSVSISNIKNTINSSTPYEDASR